MSRAPFAALIIVLAASACQTAGPQRRSITTMPSAAETLAEVEATVPGVALEARRIVADIPEPLQVWLCEPTSPEPMRRLFEALSAVARVDEAGREEQRAVIGEAVAALEGYRPTAVDAPAPDGVGSTTWGRFNDPVWQMQWREGTLSTLKRAEESLRAANSTIAVAGFSGTDNESRPIPEADLAEPLGRAVPFLQQCAKEALGPVHQTTTYRIAVAGNGVGMAVALENRLPGKEFFLEHCVTGAFRTLGYPKKLNYSQINVTVNYNID